MMAPRTRFEFARTDERGRHPDSHGRHDGGDA